MVTGSIFDSPKTTKINQSDLTFNPEDTFTANSYLKQNLKWFDHSIIILKQFVTSGKFAR